MEKESWKEFILVNFVLLPIVGMVYCVCKLGDAFLNRLDKMK
jgi:hypothetical protein